MGKMTFQAGVVNQPEMGVFEGETTSTAPTDLPLTKGSNQVEGAGVLVVHVVGQTDSPGKVSAGIELKAVVRAGIGVIGTATKTPLFLNRVLVQILPSATMLTLCLTPYPTHLVSRCKATAHLMCIGQQAHL